MGSSVRPQQGTDPLIAEFEAQQAKAKAAPAAAPAAPVDPLIAEFEASQKAPARVAPAALRPHDEDVAPQDVKSGAQLAAEDYQRKFGQKPMTVATTPAESPDHVLLRTDKGTRLVRPITVRGDSTDVQILEPHDRLVGEKDGVLTVPTNTLQQPMREAHVTVGRPLSGIEQEAPGMSQAELERAANDPNLKTRIATRLAMVNLPGGTTTKAPPITWNELVGHTVLNGLASAIPGVPDDADTGAKMEQFAREGGKLEPWQINLLAGLHSATAVIGTHGMGQAIGAGSEIGATTGSEAAGARLGMAGSTQPMRAGAQQAIADAAAANRVHPSQIAKLIEQVKAGLAARAPQLAEAGKQGLIQGGAGAVMTGAGITASGERDPRTIVEAMGKAALIYGGMGAGFSALSAEQQFQAGYKIMQSGLKQAGMAEPLAGERMAQTGGQPGEETGASGDLVSTRPAASSTEAPPAPIAPKGLPPGAPRQPAPSGTPLSPDLEQLATYAVDALTPGKHNPIDVENASAHIDQLPPDQQTAVRRRIQEIATTRGPGQSTDPLIAEFEAQQHPTEPPVETSAERPAPLSQVHSLLAYAKGDAENPPTRWREMQPIDAHVADALKLGPKDVAMANGALEDLHAGRTPNSPESRQAAVQAEIDKALGAKEPAPTAEAPRPAGSVITDEIAKRGAEETTPPEEREFIKHDSAIENQAAKAGVKDYVDGRLDDGWRVKRKGASVWLERGLDVEPLTHPAAADYALMAARRRADAASDTEPDDTPAAEPQPKPKKLEKPGTDEFRARQKAAVVADMATIDAEPAKLHEGSAAGEKLRKRRATLANQLKAYGEQAPPMPEPQAAETPTLTFKKMSMDIVPTPDGVKAIPVNETPREEPPKLVNPKAKEPLTREGALGLHILEHGGRFFFVGSIPAQLADARGQSKTFFSEHDALAAVNQYRVDRATELGTAAFERGAKAIPALDKDLEKVGGKPGSPEWTAASDAWLKAWHKANLAAPVPESSVEQPAAEPPRNRFAVEYEKELRAAVAKDPKSFAYGPDDVPAVVAKMVKAIAEKNATISHSKALKRVAKTLGIKFNLREMAKAAAEGADIAAPSNPVAPKQLRRGIAGAIAGASEDLSAPSADSGLTPSREAAVRNEFDPADFTDAELQKMSMEFRANAAAHGERGDDAKANDASFRADLVDQEIGRRDDQANGRGLTPDEELEYAVEQGDMTQREAPDEARTRVVSRFEDGGIFLAPENVDYVGDGDAQTYERAKTHPAVIGYAHLDHEHLGRPLVIEARNAPWLDRTGTGLAPGSRRVGADVVAGSAQLSAGSRVADAEISGQPAVPGPERAGGSAAGAVGADVSGVAGEERSGADGGIETRRGAREGRAPEGRDGGRGVSVDAGPSDEVGTGATGLRESAGAGAADEADRGGTRGAERTRPDAGVGPAVDRGLHDGEPGGRGRGTAPAEGGEPDHVADPIAQAIAHPVPTPQGNNYRLTDADEIGIGGRVAKVRQNIEAIRLLRQLRETDRVEASPEEQSILAKYVGWGAFPGLFDRHHADYESKAAEELRATLTDEEYERASASTKNAHYTSPDVVRAMWRIMDRFGMVEGRLLEPAMGVGNFIGFAPETMRLGWTGVEKDTLTGAIAKYLYPESQIFVSGYEDVPLRNGSFDAAIGNVPFGQIQVYDPKYKHLKGFSIHDYFFAKTIDKVRPGGIVAFITSRFTMDKVSQTVRRYIADRADLLGAMRLPHTAFKGNAGTDVVTDILFLRVREKGAAAGGESWLELAPAPVRGEEPADINEYYVRHPDMLLGRLAYTRGQFSDHDLILKPRDGEKIADAIDAAATALPAGALIPVSRPVRGAQQMAIAEAPPESRPGTYLLHGGKIMQVGIDGTMQDNAVPKAQEAKVRQLIGIRDLALRVIKLNTTNATDAEVETARKALEKAHATFLKKFGAINQEVRTTTTNKKGIVSTRTKYPNRDVIADDPDLAQLLALEHYDPDTDKARPADLITKGRVIPPSVMATAVDTGFDAIVASLAKRGRLDLDDMAQLRGVSVEALKEELKGEIFQEPGSGEWEIKAKYLSGNVRAKLEAARRYARNDPTYQQNVDALELVQPAETPAASIKVRFGAPWIEPKEYSQFLGALFGITPSRIPVTKDPHGGGWSIDDAAVKYAVANTTTFGTDKMSAVKIIERAMNSLPIRITDIVEIEGSKRTVPNPAATALVMARKTDLEDRFRKWLFDEDEDRSSTMVGRFNAEHNNIAPPKYDGKLLTVPGIATHISGVRFDWYEHQKNAIMRFLQNGSILLAHAPGAGKTYTFIAMAMEARRFGLARRPMVAVPNHMLAQATREAQQLYPGARILSLNSDDTSSKAKAMLAARAASNEWDLIITTHNGMGRIPMSKAAQIEFVREELNELRDAIEAERQNGKQSNGRPSRTLKKLEAVLENYEGRLKEMIDSPTDTSMTFEELGVDMLVVDEAHAFKNLHFATRVEGVAVGTAKSATQLYMKTKYLHKVNPTHGLVFATGTPVTNSVAELWTMQRYLNPKGLRDAGLERFDDWQNVYGTLVSRMEKNTVGNYEVKSRLAKYVNVPSMIQKFREFADVKTIAELNLPRPVLLGGRPTPVVAPEPPGMGATLAQLKDDWDALKKMSPMDAAASGMSFLSIGSKAKAAGLDLRLVDPSAPDDATYKVNLAADHIWDRYQTHHAYKGAQVVFLDGSVDKGPDAATKLGGRVGFSVYAELKRLLIAKGIPAKEIAYSQDADTDAKKAVLFRKVNDGDIRVIIGSTSQMGVGTNMQRRLVALHRLDVPWRPDQIEQSEARILRMGNKLYDDGTIPGVEIFRYVTEGSYDQYSWDTVLRKAKFVAQAMTGDPSIAELDEVADENAANAQLMAAMASNNPLELERADLTQSVAELQALASGHRTEQSRLDAKIRQTKAHLETLRQEQAAVAKDAATKTDTKGEHFSISLGGVPYTKRPDAAHALLAALAAIPKGSTKTFGAFAGFPIKAQALNLGYNVDIGSQHERSLFIADKQTETGALSQLEAAMRAVGDVEPYPAWIAKAEQNIKEYSQLVGRQFERAPELAKLEERLREVERALLAVVTRPDAPPADEDYGGGVELASFTDPFTAMYRMYRQAQALRRQRLGLPPAPTSHPLQPAIDHFNRVSTDVRALFNPAAASPEAGRASRILRANRGQSDMETARAHQAIEDVRDALDHLEPGQTYDGPRWDWYRDMEAGRLAQIHGPLKSVAHVFRALLDDLRDEIQALGPGHLDSVIEDYMPRVYKEGPKIKGGAGRQVGIRLGKRPLEGPKSFKKQRQFDTLDDAIAAGYLPISDNPIDMLFLKLREMRRYLMAQRIKEELKATGLVRFKKATKPMPDGYAMVDDRAFTVFAARGAEGEQRIRGHYVAPLEVARVVNNFLSPGLRGNAIYDSYAWLGNILNMAQLGMSAFHAGFVAFDATVQTAAIGLDQLLTGKGPGGRLAGAGKLLIGGASAATGPLTVLPLPAAVMSYLRGAKVFHAYLHDTNSVEMQRILKALTEGGGRAKMDDYYRAGNIDKLRQALKDKRWVGTVLQLPFAAVEASMYPLLEHVVPRMKLGAIHMMLEVELAKLPAGATDEDVRTVAAKVVDSIDARLGQMIYDNRFWHRATKEIMMGGIRSVGWNVGTFDVTIGGGGQAIGNVRRIVGGEPPEEQDWHKVQYLAVLAAIVALYGAIYTYLHTGDRPRGYKDFYFPRTGDVDRDGNPDRIQPATYMKDIFAIARHPVTTITHKLHPLLDFAAQTLANRDFYGDQIRNPDDPTVQQLGQIAAHAGKEFTPFSVRNAQEMAKRGERAEAKVEGFFGNQAAPRERVRTEAQTKMNEILARRGAPTRTPEEVTTRDQRQAIALDLRQGDIKRDSLRRLVRGGTLTPGQATSMAVAARENPLVTRFKMLTPEEAETVYNLGTPAEQELWKKLMHSKDRRNRLRRPTPSAPPI